MATAQKQLGRISELEDELSGLDWEQDRLDRERDNILREIEELREKSTTEDGVNVEDFARLVYPIFQIVTEGGRLGPLPKDIPAAVPRSWEELYQFIELKLEEVEA